MKKNVFVLLIIAAACAVQAQAQDKVKFEKKFDFRTQINQSFGFGMQIYGLGDIGFFQGLNYTPRLNLKNMGESKFASLDVAVPISISGSLQGGGQGGGSFLMFDLPVTAEVSLGHYANQFVDLPVGIFAGVGGSYNKIWVFSDALTIPGTINPIGTAGIRAFFLGRSLTFRYNYNFRNPLLGGYRGTVSLTTNI